MDFLKMILAALVILGGAAVQAADTPSPLPGAAALAEAAATATTEATAAATAAEVREFLVTGGVVYVSRDGKVVWRANGPTMGQRIVLVGAYIKDGVLYVVHGAARGATAADGAIAGAVAYPFRRVGEWLAEKPAAATPAPAAPAPAPAAPAAPEQGT